MENQNINNQKTEQINPELDTTTTVDELISEMVAPEGDIDQPEKDKFQSEDLQAASPEGDSASTQLTETEFKITEQIEEMKRNLELEREKYLRLLAEYDNYRKRTLQDFTRIRTSETERLILQLLPVLDDFNRLNQHGEADKIEFETFKQGVDLIHRKLIERLEAEGVVTIDAEGKVFDVNEHEALSRMDSDLYDDGSILTVIDKGYKLKDKVIRHAKVIVSRKPEESSGDSNE